MNQINDVTELIKIEDDNKENMTDRSTMQWLKEAAKNIFLEMKGSTHSEPL